MSSDFYFVKWRETLRHLEGLVQLDREFQDTKTHDKKRCEAVIRLSGILGEYIVVYNNALECWQQNLQVQKTVYMIDVVKATLNRILELKQQIRKLESNDIQFLGHGLANHKLTTNDAELEDVPLHDKRPKHVDTAIAEAFRKAEERRELLRIEEEQEQEEVEEIKAANWWDEDISEVNDEEKSVKQEEKPETEEMIQKRQMVTLIQAHERSRRVIEWLTLKNQRRAMWEKELSGKLNPPARLEIRERSAKLIQKVLRAYFESKRKKIQECKQGERIGLRLCYKVNKDAIHEAAEINKLRSHNRQIIEQQWMHFRDKLKKYYIKQRGEDIADDYRDFINGWLRKWFDDIKYFYDIPRAIDGGSKMIIKEEIPDPIEWWETYLAYLEEKKANKNKSSLQLKYEKLEAKREEEMRKKEELMKKKIEQKLMQKLMKNPTKHPGFNYPVSKRMEPIIEAMERYRKQWHDLDCSENIEVKKTFVPSVDVNEVYAEVKMNLMQTVDDDMRAQLKVLKKALKKDYETNEEPYPEPMKTPQKRAKRKKRVRVKMSENIAEKLEDLAFKGILKEYPHTKLLDYLGDHNFAGDDIRCNYEPAPHFAGETRALWWERCREATHGFQKILLVGPRQSGKTILVHALTTVIDAVLFELDPTNLYTLASSPAELRLLVSSMGTCARATQPSVIYIKHIQHLFYRKVPPGEVCMNLGQIKRSVSKMLKKMNRTDRVTVIGTCIDPWITKSTSLLKLFPTVVLVPDTSYSSVFQLLSHWVNENLSLPRNLDIHSLAHMLRGYSYGYLQETLQNFLSPERIIRIAARGLDPVEIYDYFLDKGTDKVDYEKYANWYAEKTVRGKKEMKYIEEQREFKRLLEMFAERENKKKKVASAASSMTTL